MIVLDTCALLAFASHTLPPMAQRAIVETDPMDRVALAVSAWEITLKNISGKLALAGDPHTFMEDTREHIPCRFIPVSVEIYMSAALLPFPINGHRDPSDRLIIAYALRHGAPVITSDESWEPYGVTTIWRERHLPPSRTRRRKS